ncbi:PP2C family serine/threonine-protein phosphatase [Endozoicomonas sp.]|uniref:PP2C family serine/threonine-protein phosphatase n=1 Tax=Endozoicomonas sp. TaxID=1892382 RepID=UPI003AF89B91
MLSYEPDDVLISQLLHDEAFCSIYSAIKSLVCKHIEQQTSLVANQKQEGPLVFDSATDNKVNDGKSSKAKELEADCLVDQAPTDKAEEVPETEQIHSIEPELNAEQKNCREVTSEPEFIEMDSEMATASDEGTADSETIPGAGEDEAAISSPGAEVTKTVDNSSEPHVVEEQASISNMILETDFSSSEEHDMKSETPSLQPVKERETIHVNMPNGMCGREYCQVIQLDNLHVEESWIPPELGMNFDESSNSIQGLPNQAGDFEIRLKGYIASESALDEKARKDVFVISRFTINPDPRSLWKNIASDSQARFHKPDFASSSLDIAGLRMVAASQRGRSHAHKGTHRDDEAGVQYLEKSGWHILAVADGAGSCEYSRRGSQLAIKLAMQHLSDQLDGEAGIQLESSCLNQEDLDSVLNQSTIEAVHTTLVEAAWKAVKGINAEAERNELSLKDFSTTLLLMICKSTEKGNLVLSFSIGDGAIAAYSEENGVRLLCVPDSGEFAGQTRFLDSGIFKQPDVYQRVKACILPQYNALMVMTDGITDARFETEAMLSENAPWQKLWMEIKPLLSGTKEDAEIAILDWLNFWSPGNHDDRSIAILNRGGTQ